MTPDERLERLIDLCRNIQPDEFPPPASGIRRLVAEIDRLREENVRLRTLVASYEATTPIQANEVS